MKKAIGRWIVLLVAVPVVVAVLGSVADKLERDRGHDSKSAKSVRAVKKVVGKAR